MTEQKTAVSVETDQVNPIQKVFTVLTREKHQATDFRKVAGFSVADIEVSKIPIGIGLCDDHRLGVFDSTTDDLLYQILFKEDQMRLNQEFIMIGDPDRILDLCHVILQLVEEIVKIIKKGKEEEVS